MIRLITFGALELSGAKAEAARNVLRQPKRLAVLLRLALAGPGRSVSRETLLGLFWPDQDDSRGRGALNQTLHHLRKHLGPDVVVSRGGRLALGVDSVWCDAAAFEAALENGAEAEAVALYTGDLLPGFYVEGARDFDDWLEVERKRYRRGAAEAASRLCIRSIESGEHAEAARWAFRAAGLANDELTVRTLLEAIEGAGDPAGALQVFEHYESRISAELGLEPSDDLRAVAARCRAAAEPRLRRPMQSGLKPVPSAGSESPESEAGPGPVPRHRRRPFVAVLAIVALAFAVRYLWSRSRPEAPRLDFGATGDVTIDVEPLADLTRDQQLRGLSHAISSGIVDRLASVDGIRVAVHDVQPGQPDTPAPRTPDFRTAGEVVQSADSVRVAVRLLEGRSGMVIASRAAQHQITGTRGLADALADSVSGFMRHRLGREVRLREAMSGTRSLRAWRYFKEGDNELEIGEDHWHRGSFPSAKTAFSMADSLLALAEAEDSAWSAPPAERARVATQQAWTAMLDAPASAGSAFEEVIRHAARAIRLDPNEARARELRGSARYLKAVMGYVPPDSARSALAAAERDLRAATSLNARRASAWTLLSDILSAGGDFAGSYIAAEDALRSDPYLENTLAILNRLFVGAYEVGDDDSAKKWCTAADDRYPGSAPAVSCALSVLSWRTESGGGAVDSAWALIRSAKLPPAFADRARAVLEMQAALVLARAGMRDSAEAVIHSALQKGGSDPELLGYETEVRLALGQRESALRLLRSYLAQQPGRSHGLLLSRRFQLTKSEIERLETRDDVSLGSSF